jgi:hypothetical protein
VLLVNAGMLNALKKIIWHRHFYHLFILSVRHSGIRVSSVPLVIDKPGIDYLWLFVSHFFNNLMLMTPESFLVISEQIQKLW